jgi:ELWxxDGT repeat protein
VLFSGGDSSGQTGLWTTTGTAGSTHEITGISGASGGFNPNSSGTSGLTPYGLTLLNSRIWFGGYDTSGKAGLWVTAGTAASTKEIAGTSGLAPLALTAFNGGLVFSGLDAWGYRGLWVSDGTAAGTKQLTNIGGASDRQNTDGTLGFNPSNFSIVNGQVLFEAYDAAGTRGLWATNGTAAGTFELKSGNGHALTSVSLAGNPPAVSITSSGGLVNSSTQTVTGKVTAGGAAITGTVVTLFDNGVKIGTASVGRNGIWSANVTLAYGDNNLLAADTDAGGATGVSGTVCYIVDTGPNVVIGTSGGAVGTATQTVWGKVTAAAGEPAFGSTVTLYDNGTKVGVASVNSDGTWVAKVNLVNGANSIVAKNTDANGKTGASNAVSFTLSPALAQTTYAMFSGKDASGKTGLWVTNGTAQGTRELTGITGASNKFNPNNFVQFNGKIYFAASDSNDSTPQNLWVTDGTAAGTKELTGISGAFIAGLWQWLNPQYLTPLGNSLLFSGLDGHTNTGLWISNGTAAGTHELIGIQGAWPWIRGSAPSGEPAGVYGLDPTSLTAFNGKVLFAGYVNDTFGSNGLWVTDGTVSGTKLIADNTANYKGLRPTDLTLFNNQVYFNGYDANFLHGLWVSDGTSGGTYEVVGISGANTVRGIGLNPQDLTAFNGKLLFQGTGTGGNANLWVSDGTVQGTREIVGVTGANSAGLMPSNMTVLGLNVLFSGRNQSGNYGLWITDGTARGTYELTGIAGASTASHSDGTKGLDPTNFALLNGKLVFDAFDSLGKQGLWVTDGTIKGTYELTGLTGAATGGVKPAELTTVHATNTALLSTYMANTFVTAGASAMSAVSTAKLDTIPPYLATNSR